MDISVFLNFSISYLLVWRGGSGGFAGGGGDASPSQKKKLPILV
jgi:hypothetical protein